MATIRTVDVDKLQQAVADFKEKVKPTEADMQDNSMLRIYWNAIDVATHIMTKAIEVSSVEIK